MPVFRWGDSWNPLRDLEREVDRLLQSVNLGFHGFRAGRQYPPVNVYQQDEDYLLVVELPGMRADEVELTVSGGILTMKGMRRDPEGIADDRFRRRERFRGPWQRSLSLPEGIEEERLSAEFANGILKIRLPKAEASKSRQIPIIEGEG